MMVTGENVDIIETLDALGRQVKNAEVMLSNGEDIAALRLLNELKEPLNHVIVQLVMQCLRENLDQQQDNDLTASDCRARRCMDLLNFALVSFCPDCQNRIAVRLKEI